MSPLFLFLLPITLVFAQDLQVGFYNSSCPQAESIVQAVVQKHFSTDPSIAAAFLHLHFHDCIVRGCDASVLIDITKKLLSEKWAGPNMSLRRLEIIDEIKLNLEAQCPSTISCADIIALATRDAVALAGGLSYDVPTGRRDGLRSNADDVNIPGPAFSLSEVMQIFTSKGLTLEDMVVLLGAHTIGVAHCHNFQVRLLTSLVTGKPIDPTIDPSLKVKLLQVCGTTLDIVDGKLVKDPTAFLDQNTSMVIDNSFYNQILKNKGLLQFDQQVARDNSTREIVERLASDNDEFLEKFAKALVKMGKIEVLVGSEGEIRRNCRVFNTPS